MQRMKKWKKLIVMLVLLPIMAFFPACGCNEEPGEPTLKPTNVTYTVHFFTNSDETFNIPNQYIQYGGLVQKPEDPTKYGYSFVAWYTDQEFKKESIWAFETNIVTQTITLYARWEKRI